MKLLLASTVCTLPLALGSLAYAQTTPPPATDTPPATESPTQGTGTPPAPGTPGTPGAPGTTPSPMDTTPPGSMDSPMVSPGEGETTETLRGWSVKDSVIGRSVYNENDEKVGDVNDVVLSPDGQVTHFIVGAGGFLGMGQHDVAIPFDELERGDDRLMLSGYTKDQLKALPKVELAE